MKCPELLVDLAGFRERNLMVRIPRGSEVSNELCSPIYSEMTNMAVHVISVRVDHRFPCRIGCMHGHRVHRVW